MSTSKVLKNPSISTHISPIGGLTFRFAEVNGAVVDVQFTNPDDFWIAATLKDLLDKQRLWKRENLPHAE